MRETKPVMHLHSRSQEGHADQTRTQAPGPSFLALLEGPVEGVSVHTAISILQFPQVEETLSETRVRLVQTRVPDGLAEKTSAPVLLNPSLS